MIPADLLIHLREKDPALFRGVIGGFPLKNGKYLSILDMEPPAALAWFQHCLQEAIRKRGWGYQLYSPAIGFTDFMAWVQSDRSAQGRGNIEAEALCRAYLAAIQEAT